MLVVAVDRVHAGPGGSAAVLGVLGEGHNMRGTVLLNLLRITHKQSADNKVILYPEAKNTPALPPTEAILLKKRMRKKKICEKQFK